MIMPLSYIAISLWSWVIDTGLSLALLIVIAFLIPRAGRLAMYFITNKFVAETEADSKTQLAFAGVVVYIAQIISYFVVFVFMLKALGFSLAGAAIPATAASAAIGLGAQSIIADFLAGFFILSEKQYGVGDWVRFEGGATNIEGTVIQITMRATRIRTLAEETVIIPNSKAGVSINNSNHWSSAVVVMPIPLTHTASVSDTIERSTAAANRALTEPKVAEVVLGPLAVHPAVGITAPTTLGMPWSIDMRFLAQVKPGSQWLVERAIRVKLIDEFWEEYSTTVETSPTLSAATTPMAELPATTRMPATPPPQPEKQTTEGTLSPAAAESQTERGLLVEDDPAVTEPTGTFNNQEKPPSLQEEKVTGWERFFSVGGRTRVSTTILLAAIVVILILKGLTLSPEGTEATGWLAPPTATPRSTNAVPPSATAPETEAESMPVSETEATSTQSSPAVSESPTTQPSVAPGATETNPQAEPQVQESASPQAVEPAPSSDTNPETGIDVEPPLTEEPQSAP